MTDSKPGITRRELGALMAASAAVAQVRTSVPVTPQGPVLDIAEWSYLFYGVEHATLARGTVCNGMQVYVERWFPSQVKHPFPVVLVHGGYGQGSDWISTPDGRRGWVSLLLEQGYKVYLVDRPGQGRNPYHPWVHGNFDAQAQTFEGTARRFSGSTQFPGAANASDPAVIQITAALGQPMGNNATTRNVWRTRGAFLLDEIGPAIFITLGDGAAFALVTAQDRPNLVKGIVAVEPTAPLATQAGLPGPLSVPVAVLRSESSVVNAGTVSSAQTEIRLAERGIRGNGPMPIMEKNNREVLQVALDWMDSVAPPFPMPVSGVDRNRNSESTALKLADQGCFWVGAVPKQMAYGTIPQGQMYVQYMIPAERRSPYPVVLTHGGGGQGTHMMGIGGRPGWVHYFVQAGYAVYWLDRPSYGRSPYHPDALGPSHLPNVPPFEGLLQSTTVFNTAQWPGPGGMKDPWIDQFMACESGNVSDEAFHSDLAWRGGVELLDRIGPSILVNHAYGGFFGWGVADRRPNLVKAILSMEINGNPFAAQLRWGLTASPVAYDPPVASPAEFKLVDQQAPPDSPRPIVSPYKLQAEPAHKWKNLQGIPMAWLTTEFGGGGSPVANVAFLKQVGCSVEMLRLRDHGILGNGNLMLLEKNNHEVFAVIHDWLDRNVKV